MPSRNAHTAITCSVSVVPLLATPIVGLIPALAVAFGILITIPFKAFGTSVYLNPDMDIKSNDSAFSRAIGVDAYQTGVKHRAGLSRKDWVGFWRNPAKIFLFSHIPVFGTFPRWTPVALLLFVVSFIIPINETVYLWSFAGMSLADTFHVLADVVCSATKTRKG